MERLERIHNTFGPIRDRLINYCFTHSHVSLLIEMGYSALMIADRIGDTVETTLKTYSHLYPDKQVQFVNKLEEMNNDNRLIPKPPIKIRP